MPGTSTIAADPTIVTLGVRLFNARFGMRRGVPGQRARFFALLDEIGRRRREMFSRSPT